MLLLTALFLWAGAAPAKAADGSRCVFILVPGVTARAFLDAASQPQWGPFRSAASLALVNPSVPGEAQPFSAYLTVSTGQRLRCPTGEPWAIWRDVLDWANGYQGQRVGKPMPRSTRPREAIIPMLGPILGIGIVMPRLGPGALHAALYYGRKSFGYLGPLSEDYRFRSIGIMAGTDGNGNMDLAGGVVHPPGSALAVEKWVDALPPILERASVVAVDLPVGATAGDALAVAEGISRRLDRARDLILVTSPNPGAPLNGQWRGLAPAFIWGAGWEGGLASSGTTRTPGLVANVDLVSTLLAHQGTVPLPQMEGRPARPVGESGASDPIGLLRTMARHAEANRAAMLPVLLGWGAVALVAAGSAVLGLTRIRTEGLHRFARLLLVFTASFPAALLLGAVVPPASALEVGLRVFILAAVVAAISWRIGGHRSSLLTAYAITCAVIVVDLVTGGRMLARNVMSDFLNIGARFYGIGNEYLGILLGMLLLIPIGFAALNRDRFGGREWRLTGGAWFLSLVAVGAPWWGADFGGALSLAVAFLAAGALLWQYYSGRELSAGKVLLGLLVVGGLGAALVALDLARPADQRTHVGQLAARIMRDGAWVLIEVAIRKTLLNLNMAASPYFVGGLIVVAPFLGLWYSVRGRADWEMLKRHPLLLAGVKATVVGAVATLLLNDTGVIAWALAMGALLVFWLDLLLGDSLKEGVRERTDEAEGQPVAVAT